MLSDKIKNKANEQIDRLEKLEIFARKKSVCALINHQNVYKVGATINHQNEKRIYKYGYIYLIREREFLLRGEDVYKVGATVQNFPSLQIRRLSDYKKGSQLLCTCICDYNIVFNIEKQIKELFNKKFNRHPDGTEYFIGNPNEMLKIIYDTVLLIKNMLSVNKLFYTENKNINLICFTNGVYDLNKKIFVDTDTKEHHKQSNLYIGYDYIGYNKKNKHIIDMKIFLKKIQPDKILRRYLITLLSTCLVHNYSKNLYIFKGSDFNGVNKLIKLLEYTFGDYFVSIDIETIKNEKSLKSFTENLMYNDARICFFDGLGATDEINMKFIEIFTGSEVAKKKLTPILLCNELPAIKNYNDNFWEKIKVILFLSKFIKPTEATKDMRKNGLNKDHFWEDETLSDKILGWKEIFMSMMLKYYKKYKGDIIIHPKIVTQWTTNYCKHCDIFQDFLEDYLEKTNEQKDAIRIVDLHEEMKNWYKVNYDGKCPNRTELRNYIQQKILTYCKESDLLKCFKFKTNNNDDIFDKLKIFNN
jgi:thiol-disulfide isomerase/thioredoxin